MKNKKFQYVISRVKRLLSRSDCAAKAGFLLIEIMTALIAFAGLAILVAGYQVSIVRSTKDAQSYLQGVTIACDVLDRGTREVSKPNQFKVERIVKEFVIPSQCKEQGLSVERLKKIKLITAQVSWALMDGNTQTVALESVQTLIDDGQKG